MPPAGVGGIVGVSGGAQGDIPQVRVVSGDECGECGGIAMGVRGEQLLVAACVALWRVGPPGHGIERSGRGCAGIVVVRCLWTTAPTVGRPGSIEVPRAPRPSAAPQAVSSNVDVIDLIHLLHNRRKCLRRSRTCAETHSSSLPGRRCPLDR